MTGGEIQLASYGAQDHYLTGNPQISFFKMVYRRYTNFSMESIITYFDGNDNLLLNNNITLMSKIQRIGDLISKIYFVFELPDIYSRSNNGIDYKFKWIKNIGTNIIDNVRVLLNGNIIDRHYGEWLNIWHEINLKNSEKKSFNEMIGNVIELYDPENAYGNFDINGNKTYPTSDGNIPSIPSRKVYVPLPFWFSQNTGLALPLLALQYTDLEVYIDLRPLNDLFTIIETTSNNPNYGKRVKPNEYHNFGLFLKDVGNITSLDIKPYLESNFIFLDADERNKFAGSDHNYLIQTVRRVNSSGHNNFANIKLELQHPVKELIWVGKRDDVNERNDWNNYSNWIYEGTPSYRLQNYQRIYNYGNRENGGNFYPDPGDSTQDWRNYTYLKEDIITDAKLLLNGMDRFDAKDSNYFKYIQPFQHYQNSIKNGIFLYSFSMNPDKFQPSGSCNMSRVNNISIQFNINNPPTIPGIDPDAETSNRYYYLYDFNIYAVNYNVLKIMNGLGGLEFSN